MVAASVVTTVVKTVGPEAVVVTFVITAVEIVGPDGVEERVVSAAVLLISDAVKVVGVAVDNV